MRIKTFCLPLVLAALALVSSVTSAAELRWKFKSGEELQYILSRATEGKINLSGSDIVFNLQMIFDTSWKPTAVAADGNADVDLTVTRIQIAMDSPLFGRMAYDSKNPEEPKSPVWAQMKPTMTAMLGEAFKAKISPLGAVTDIQLPAKLADALAKQEIGENRRQGFGIGGNSFNEKGIKELLSRSVLPLPEGPGDDATWTQTFVNELPGIGVMTSETTFSRGGEEEKDGKKLAKITAESEMLFEPAEEPKADLEITEQDADATFLFDAEAGRLVSADGVESRTMELTGPQEIVQTVKETVSMKQGQSAADKSVTDAKPVEKKEAEKKEADKK
jgi:hypothetical protein